MTETPLRHSGFTLVELIVTMMLIGIMAVVAVPRLANRISFDTRGYADQTLAAIQYARKVAMAAQRNVCVTVSEDKLSLTLSMAENRGDNPDCSAPSKPVKNPASGDDYSVTAPSGVSYASVTNPLVSFDMDGVSSGGSLIVRGDFDIRITIETTGHAYSE